MQESAGRNSMPKLGNSTLALYEMQPCIMQARERAGLSSVPKELLPEEG